MGIRGAALGQVELCGVSVPLNARLGEDEASDNDYSEALALARLGWAALAVGTSHAVLDYVVPYVKQRQAFGEPIAHRQAVAFMCANIAIELDGLRLITWRGASRAEQGLPFAREAALAKRLGSDKGMQIGLTGCNCWAATATPRSIRLSAGTATCEPSASPRALLSSRTS